MENKPSHETCQQRRQLPTTRATTTTATMLTVTGTATTTMTTTTTSAQHDPRIHFIHFSPLRCHPGAQMSRLVGTRGPDQDSHKHIFTDFNTGLWIWVAPCPGVLYKFKQAGTKGSKVCFSSNQTHAGLYRIVFL